MQPYPIPRALSVRETTPGPEYNLATEAIPAFFGNWQDLTSRAVSQIAPILGSSFILPNSERYPNKKSPQLNLIGHRFVKSLAPLSASETFMTEVVKSADHFVEHQETEIKDLRWSESFGYALGAETDAVISGAYAYRIEYDNMEDPMMSTRTATPEYIDGIQSVSEAIGVLLTDAIRFDDSSYTQYFDSPESHPVIAKIAELNKTTKEQVFEDMKETLNHAHRASLPEPGEEGVRSYVDFEDYLYLSIVTNSQTLERTDLIEEDRGEIERHQKILEELRSKIERDAEWRNKATRQEVQVYIDTRFKKLRTKKKKKTRKFHEETQVLLSLNVVEVNFKIPSPKRSAK